jgi:hypothetical protein
MPRNENFNSMLDSFAVLVQLLIGEMWHRIMYEGTHQPIHSSIKPIKLPTKHN